MRSRIAGLMAVLAVSWVSAEAQAASPAVCGPGDRQETGLQGQIPMVDRVSGRAADGYNCNLDEVGSFASTAFANFDTYENCAYYSDTIGLYSAEGGTIVLDATDPRRPVQTAYLTDGPVKNAGESLRVHRERGLLVADRYTISDQARFVDDPDTARSLSVYDVKDDCRKPKLLANVIMPRAVGHEGCFQTDGMVYYMASTSTITPIDLSDPANPKELSAPYPRGIHGCSTSEDGNRGYFADIGEGRMLVVDTSEVQARRPDAQMRDIGEFRTPNNTGQQSTIPLTYDGRPYLLDWSEFTELLRPCVPGDGRESNFGYALLLDMADERNPKEVSRMQSEVQLPENCSAVLADSVFLAGVDGLVQGDVFALAGSRVFLYDSHYCSVDRQHDPTIAACSSFGQGVRVYDIRDPKAPKEIAYYNPGVVTAGPAAIVANAAVARPVIRSDLGQIWFPDIAKGFHVLQFREGVWPFRDHDPCPHEDAYLAQYDLGYRACRAQRKAPVALPSAKPCRTTRTLTLRLSKERLRVVRVYVNGKLKRTLRNVRGRVTLRGLPRRAYRLRVVARTRSGRTITKSRRYKTCLPSGKTVPRTAPVAEAMISSRMAAQIIAFCRLAGRSLS